MCEARNRFETVSSFRVRVTIGDGSFASPDPVCGRLASPASVVGMQQARPDRPLLVRYGGTALLLLWNAQLVVWVEQMPPLLQAEVLRADM